jgi:LPXTG-site transpeptidase (sortase) family protein
LGLGWVASASSHLRRATVAVSLVVVCLALVVGAPASPVAAQDRAPEAIRIGSIGVTAPIEVRTTIDNRMQDPTGPWVVAWYDDSALPGGPGNVVVAGHVDDQGAGTAVFARLGEVARGDRIAIRGGDGEAHWYEVIWSKVYSAAPGPWGRLTGPTKRPSLTLITCAPPWDPAIGTYANRLVVRAVLVDG